MLLPARRHCLLLALGIVSLAANVSAQPNKFPFTEQDMPFNAPAVERDIDRRCVAEGSAKDAPRQAQNRAKNNFSAQGTPAPVVIEDFDRLERATVRARTCWAKNLSGCKKLALDKSSGMPSDRTQLEEMATTAGGDKVGEGTVVVLEAKVLDSHYSNTKYNRYGKNRGKGESVNCKGLKGSDGVDWNDIHIVLAAPGETNQCMSVTAEISPHFRPNSWRRFHDMNNKGITETAKAKGVNFGKLRMVRITGPLFYDASHEPCSPGHTNVSPKRRSLWEIHPVHKLEVQTKAGKWMSFDDWAKTQ